VFVIVGSVLSGSTKNVTESMRVMDDMLTAVPLLLQKLRSSDILPAPCLKEFHHVVKEEEEELRDRLELNKEEDEEDEGLASECWQEGDDKERHPNSPNVIYAEKLGRRQGKSAHYDKLFRLNPLVKIITSADIKQFQRNAPEEKWVDTIKKSQLPKWDQPTNSMAYIVHAGYGNETYDSVLRQVIIIPELLRSSAELLLEAFTEHQEARLAVFTSDNQKATKKRDRDHEIIVDQQWQNTGQLTIRSIAKHGANWKFDLQDMGQVFEAFFVAGALTLIE
jgi:hypothetical protein